MCVFIEIILIVVLVVPVFDIACVKAAGRYCINMGNGYRQSGIELNFGHLLDIIGGIYDIIKNKQIVLILDPVMRNSIGKFRIIHRL